MNVSVEYWTLLALTGVPGTQAYAHTVLAELEIALGNVEQAMISFGSAKDYAQLSADPLRSIKVDLSYIDALLGLERYAEADRALRSTEEVLTQQGPSMLQAQALALRGDLWKAAGDRVAANAARRQARQIQLKIAGAEHDMELIALGKSLELANQTIELNNARERARLSEMKAKDAVNLRNMLMITAVFLSFAAYLILSRRYAREMSRAVQETNAELERKVSERTAALEMEMAERLRIEAERQSLAQNLAENEKLQALGQLTSGIAHDFNNLMTVVALSAEQLREVVEEIDGDAAQDVDNILSAAESATDITASLLAYVRKQPLVPQATSLDRFLTDSLPLFESTLGSGIKLDVEIEPCAIRVDRGKLTTSIINLLLNAKEALEGRGNIRLSVKECTRPDEYGEPITWIAISVIDQGQGMTPVELRRATEPFYTTKALGHGTGLGLSMVDGFAKQSGGFLQIDSSKGDGTEVTLFIPPNSAVEEAEADPLTHLPGLPPEGVVMIVDDQAAIRDVLSRLLDQMGLATLSVSSGEEALKLLETRPCPDLLITDLMMPGAVNGQQLASAVRQKYVALPVLIMSGYTDSVELDVEFLHKPFSLDDLQLAIGRAIAQNRAA